MVDYLLDTGVLIRHLRNYQGYRELVIQLADEGQLYIASFTRLEVIRGMHDHERDATFALLNGMLTHPLDEETADEAGEIVRVWRSKGITLSGPDAVIAASAIRCQATLVTTNAKHLPMAQLSVMAADKQGGLQRYRSAP